MHSGIFILSLKYVYRHVQRLDLVLMNSRFAMAASFESLKFYSLYFESLHHTGNLNEFLDIRIGCSLVTNLLYSIK